MRKLLFAASLLLALPGLESAAWPQQPAACDRACLDGMLSRFLDAVIAKDPARAPLAIGFRQTQNSVLTPAGTGAWQTVTAIGPVQRRYFDPVTGNAAFFGVVTDGGAAGGRLAAAAGRGRPDHRRRMAYRAQGRPGHLRRGERCAVRCRQADRQPAARARGRPGRAPAARHAGGDRQQLFRWPGGGQRALGARARRVQPVRERVRGHRPADPLGRPHRRLPGPRRLHLGLPEPGGRAGRRAALPADRRGGAGGRVSAVFVRKPGDERRRNHSWRCSGSTAGRYGPCTRRCSTRRPTCRCPTGRLTRAISRSSRTRSRRAEPAVIAARRSPAARCRRAPATTG